MHRLPIGVVLLTHGPKLEGLKPPAATGTVRKLKETEKKTRLKGPGKSK
jgi:hypothetical protein